MKECIAVAVLEFWFGSEDLTQPPRLGQEARWFTKDPAFDAELVDHFSTEHLRLHDALLRRDIAEQPSDSRICLAQILVLDQFTRNMYRDTSAMFASDDLARELCYRALALGLDREVHKAKRSFFYMPLMHSEAPVDQQRSLELFADFPHQVSFAESHRRIIERFGRFPHRNALVGRESTPEEVEFLKQDGSSF